MRLKNNVNIVKLANKEIYFTKTQFVYMCVCVCVCQINFKVQIRSRFRVHFSLLQARHHHQKSCYSCFQWGYHRRVPLGGIDVGDK